MAQARKRGIKSSAQDNFLAPQAVTGLTATDVGTSRAFNNGSATLSWSLPAGSPAATSYDITTTPATTTTNVATTSATITGLSSNTNYTFTVVAKNASGSSAGTTSSSVLITTVPATPSAPSASTVANAAQDSVSWTAPANGGKAITNYGWESNDGKSGTTASTSVTVNQEAGTAQTYRVRAQNANGWSDWSAYSGSVTTFSFTPFSFTPYSFTPYSFVPYSFTPYSFTPFSFTPYTFTPFSFTPYTFTPFSFSPYSFTPVAFQFTPFAVCVDEDTPIHLVGPDGGLTHKFAKDVVVGDQVWSVTWDEFVDESVDPMANQVYASMTNASLVPGTVVSVEESSKTSTIIFNEDMNKRFTLEEKVLIKKDGQYSFAEAKYVVSGDIMFTVHDGDIVETEVTSTRVIDQARLVYKFNISPVDTLIAGGMVVHNGKTF